jgi:hypothetical protein
MRTIIFLKAICNLAGARFHMEDILQEVTIFGHTGVVQLNKNGVSSLQAI